MNIDINKTYQLREYEFENFINLGLDELKEILVWRNHPEVRKVMYTDSCIALSDHLSFVSRLKDRADCYYWLVKKDGKGIGVISITDVEKESGSAQPGYYLAPALQDSGLGIEFIETSMDFLFNSIGCTSLWGRTQVNNKNALFVNYYLGFSNYSTPVEIGGKQYFELSQTREEYNNRKYKSNANVLQAMKSFKQIYSNLIQKYGNQRIH